MPTFRVSGATGQAPTTVWFGFLPDRLNMMLPCHWETAENQLVIDAETTPANLANLWTPFNTQFTGGANHQTLTFGGFTTAPDGTTNAAQQLVEDSTNSQHYITAGYFTGSEVSGNIRLAGFFKNAGRRVILAMTIGKDGGVGIGTSGVKAIYDLAGGQIGVAAHQFGVQTIYIALGSQIIPYGNGWYLCILDAFIPETGNIAAASLDVRCAVYLDNGTGTSAESSTYAGDGASGAYGWKTNCMPIRAYGLNSVSYFEDFVNGTSTFDLSDTRADGFSWYLHNQWPRLGTDGGGNIFPQPKTDSRSITVSSSVLTIDASTFFNSSNYAQVQSAAYTTDITPAVPFVGFSFTFPALLEARMGFNDAVATGGQPGSIWSSSIPSVLQVKGIEGTERDFMEWGAASVQEQVASEGIGIFYAYEGILKNQTTFVINTTTGITPWSSLKTYPPAACVASGGVFYVSNASGNTNKLPPNPSFWTVLTNQNHVVTDLTQFHLYSWLLLPSTHTENGFQMCFFDGLLAAQNTSGLGGSIGGNYAQGSPISTGDGQKFPIFLLVPKPSSMNVDFLRLAQ